MIDKWPDLKISKITVLTNKSVGDYVHVDVEIPPTATLGGVYRGTVKIVVQKGTGVDYVRQGFGGEPDYVMNAQPEVIHNEK
jgi:hypothetical protein